MALPEIQVSPSLTSHAASTDTTLQWRKSTRSGKSGCLEMARSAQHVVVRDSQSLDSSALVFPVHQWTRFIRAVKEGTLPGDAAA
jgi:hypothetical protein